MNQYNFMIYDLQIYYTVFEILRCVFPNMGDFVFFMFKLPVTQTYNDIYKIFIKILIRRDSRDHLGYPRIRLDA